MPPWTVFGRVRPHAILSRLTKQLHSGEIILSGPQLELKNQREDANWPLPRVDPIVEEMRQYLPTSLVKARQLRIPTFWGHEGMHAETSKR